MDTLAHRVEAAKAQLRLQAQRVAVLVAQTSLALITLRIQRDGLPGGVRYSTNPVPTFWFGPKALNAAGRAYVKKNATGTWDAFRQAQGLPGGTVNLTYTGRMFRSLQPVPAGGTATVAAALIVSSNAQDAKVLAYNEERYGQFLKPTAAEQTQLDALGAAELNKIVTAALSGF